MHIEQDIPVDALMNELSGRKGDFYKIKLRYVGDDPRTKLFRDNKLSDLEFIEIRHQIQRFDSTSKLGNWTLNVTDCY